MGKSGSVTITKIIRVKSCLECPKQHRTARFDTCGMRYPGIGCFGGESMFYLNEKTLDTIDPRCPLEDDCSNVKDGNSP